MTRNLQPRTEQRETTNRRLEPHKRRFRSFRTVHGLALPETDGTKNLAGSPAQGHTALLDDPKPRTSSSKDFPTEATN